MIMYICHNEAHSVIELLQAHIHGDVDQGSGLKVLNVSCNAACNCGQEVNLHIVEILFVIVFRLTQIEYESLKICYSKPNSVKQLTKFFHAEVLKSRRVDRKLGK